LRWEKSSGEACLCPRRAWLTC